MKYGLTTLMILALAIAGCKKDKDDDQAKMLLGLGLLSAGQTAVKNAAQVRGTTAAISSSVATAANSGQVAFHLDRIPTDRHQLMALIQQKASKTRLERDFNRQILPTTLTHNGGTCNASGCSTTLTGSASCPAGGTWSTSNLVVAFSMAAVGGLPSFSGTMKGDITLTKCSATAVDYFRFPSYVASTSSGNINYDGTTGFTISSLTTSGTNSVTIVGRVIDKGTIVSSNLSINGDPAMAVNITNALDINLTSVATNIVSSMTSSSFKLSETLNDTLTGTVSATGTAGGTPVSVSRTYNGDKFTYNVSCTMDLTAGSGDCVVN